MEQVKGILTENGLTVALSGHIDSSNAASVEAAIGELRAQNPGKEVLVDADDLEYISSAGLRVILRLRKECPTLRVVNVRSEVYEVFEMTGFTDMMPIEKGYRRISVEGCEVIGQGSNGKVYRLDPDTIIKVYLNPDSLPDIQRERELARKAFVMGIPTAIPYDVVRVGEGYGSVFEALNSVSLSNIIQKTPERWEECTQISVELLKKIHGTEVPDGGMPVMKEVALGWAEFLRDYLPAEEEEKLLSLIRAVPDQNTLLHGDYHVKNVMIQNGEALLIDMDTLCTGNPVFEFASIFLGYQGFAELDHEQVKRFLGIPFDIAEKFWNKTLQLYFGTTDPETLRSYSDRARIIGYTRLMRRTIRRIGFEDPQGKAIIENCKKQLSLLLARVDSLAY